MSRSMSHVSSNCIRKKRYLIIYSDETRRERWKGITTKAIGRCGTRYVPTQLERLSTHTGLLSSHRFTAARQSYSYRTSGFRVVESPPDGEHLMKLRRCRVPYGWERRYNTDWRILTLSAASFGAFLVYRTGMR